MNTTELQTYMMRDRFIKPYFGGVLARNQLPKHEMSKPKIYIINQDPLGQPGSHWVAVWIGEKMAIYFDSVGNPPPKDFEHFLIIHGAEYMFNTERLQDYDSQFCGHFCLCFSYFVCRNYDFSQFLNIFSNSLELNDILVKYFYELTL